MRPSSIDLLLPFQILTIVRAHPRMLESLIRLNLSVAYQVIQRVLLEVVTRFRDRPAQVRRSRTRCGDKTAPFRLALLRSGVRRLKEGLKLEDLKFPSFDLQIASNFHELLLLPLDLLLTVQLLLFELVLQQFNLFQLRVKLELKVVNDVAEMACFVL